MDIKSNRRLEFRISQQILLRKRPDSNEPCNSNLLEYDLYLKLQMIRQMRCIPIYWKSDLLTNATEFPECLSQLQVKKSYDIINAYKDTIETSEKPCLDMFAPSSYSWISQKELPIDYPDNQRESVVQFLYTDRYYQEIEYVKDFGFESFWSSVGGFVGIFLGYSMRQLPGLIVFLADCWINIRTYVFAVIKLDPLSPGFCLP